MPGANVPNLAGYLTDPAAILRLAGDIARRFRPQKIILFGSHAYGDPTEDSDVDLLIVMPHRGPAHRTATRIRLAVDVRFPMDLLVRSPAELAKGMSQHDWFIIEVLEKGIVLYDRSNPAVGAKGRSRLRRRLASAAVAQAPSIAPVESDYILNVVRSHFGRAVIGTPLVYWFDPGPLRSNRGI